MHPAHATWTDLPPLPEAVAGQCVGVAGEWLVVAGGSLWSAPQWAHGVKTWSDRVYGLQHGAAAWKLLGTLPLAMGYGAAAQDRDTLLCVGGQNAAEVFRSAFRIAVSSDGALSVTHLPDLSEPITNAAAAITRGTLYVFGGQTTLQPQGTTKHAQQLDLKAGRAWLPMRTPWQHARILPAAVGCADGVFVGGGADLSAAPDGTPVRSYLRNAWRFDPRSEAWHSLPDLPAAVTAAPSLCSASGEWVIFGGDDGALASQIQQLRDNHPGFRREVLRYHAGNREWRSSNELPLSLVTSGAALWQGHFVIAGGENQPGHRSPRVVQSAAH